MSTEHLEKDIDMYFPKHLREEAKKQLKLLIEIAGLNGEVKAYKQCNQDIREVNQEMRSNSIRDIARLGNEVTKTMRGF